MFVRAHEGRRGVLGDDAHDTIRSGVERGRELHALGQYAESEAVLADIERHAARSMGPDSPLALHAAHIRALSLHGLGRRADALTALRRVHGARVTHMGELHRDTLDVASDLGQLLGRTRSTRVEGRALLQLALAAAEVALGTSSKQTVRTRERLEAVERALENDFGDLEDGGADDAPTGELVALLAHLYVAPEDRRRGAARAALHLLATEAWEAGAMALEARVPTCCALVALLLDAGFLEQPSSGSASTGADSSSSYQYARVRLERPCT